MNTRMKIPLNLAVYSLVSVLFIQNANGLGLHIEQLPSTIGVSVCVPGMSYNLEMASLLANIPNFTTPAVSCGTHTPSSTVSMACEWHPQDFLQMTYQRGVELMRHGVPKEDAFQIFKHSRAVLWNFQVCNPIRNNATRVTIPLALETLYGVIVAQFQAKYSTAFASPVTSLTSSMQTAVYDLESVSASYPLNLDMPDEVLPGQNILTSNVQSTVRYGDKFGKNAGFTAQPQGRVALDPSARMTITQSECDASAPANTWILRQYPYLNMLIDEKQHCCASACIWLLESIAITPTGGLLDPCCDKCNKYNCNPFNATAVAAIEHQTRIEVPALLNAYATVVIIQV